MQNKEIIVFDDVLGKADNITKDKIKNNLRKNNKDMIAYILHKIYLKYQVMRLYSFIDNKKIVIDKQENLINQNKIIIDLNWDICKKYVDK